MPSLPRPVSRLFTWAGSAKAVAATVLFLAQYTIGSALPIMLVGEIQVPIILALLITSFTAELQILSNTSLSGYAIYTDVSALQMSGSR